MNQISDSFDRAEAINSLPDQSESPNAQLIDGVDYNKAFSFIIKHYENTADDNKEVKLQLRSFIVQLIYKTYTPEKYQAMKNLIQTIDSRIEFTAEDDLEFLDDLKFLNVFSNSCEK